jgi:hypothetical protein
VRGLTSFLLLELEHRRTLLSTYVRLDALLSEGHFFSRASSLFVMSFSPNWTESVELLHA